jgi:hypothetical protein
MTASRSWLGVSPADWFISSDAAHPLWGRRRASGSEFSAPVPYQSACSRLLKLDRGR